LPPNVSLVAYLDGRRLYGLAREIRKLTPAQGLFQGERPIAEELGQRLLARGRTPALVLRVRNWGARTRDRRIAIPDPSLRDPDVSSGPPRVPGSYARPRAGSPRGGSWAGR